MTDYYNKINAFYVVDNHLWISDRKRFKIIALFKEKSQLYKR